MATDWGDLAVLNLLDLSAAFDTVDHATLLRRLETLYGLGGSVISWLRFYPDGRTLSAAGRHPQCQSVCTVKFRRDRS